MKSDKYTKNRFEAEVRCGGTTINDVILHVSNSGLPFGGFGQSGIGSYHGYAGFVAFSHMKSIYKQLAPEFMMGMLRPPYTNSKIKMLNLFMKKNPRPKWRPNIRVSLVFSRWSSPISAWDSLETTGHLTVFVTMFSASTGA